MNSCANAMNSNAKVTNSIFKACSILLFPIIQVKTLYSATIHTANVWITILHLTTLGLEVLPVTRDGVKYNRKMSNMCGSAKT